MLTRDRAVCIRATDYSETSQIVTFFTRVTGKISAIAKGAKRVRSSFDGPIEVLSFGDIVFTEPRHDALSTLTEYVQHPRQGGFGRNLLALHCGLFAAELLNRLTHDADPHILLFDQFLQFVQDLDGQGPRDPQRDILIRLILVQLALLREVGLRPVLGTCTNCKRRFSDDWRQVFFSSMGNGLVCRDCEMSFPDRTRLTIRAARSLTNLRDLPQTPDETLDEIETVLIRHFTETLGHRPKMAKHILKRPSI